MSSGIFLKAHFAFEKYYGWKIDTEKSWWSFISKLKKYWLQIHISPIFPKILWFIFLNLFLKSLTHSNRFIPTFLTFSTSEAFVHELIWLAARCLVSVRFYENPSQHQNHLQCWYVEKGKTWQDQHLLFLIICFPVVMTSWTFIKQLSWYRVEQIVVQLPFIYFTSSISLLFIYFFS